MPLPRSCGRTLAQYFCPAGRYIPRCQGLFLCGSFIWFFSWIATATSSLHPGICCTGRPARSLRSPEVRNARIFSGFVWREASAGSGSFGPVPTIIWWVIWKGHSDFEALPSLRPELLKEKGNAQSKISRPGFTKAQPRGSLRFITADSSCSSC